MKIAIFTNNYLPNPYGVAGSIESFRKEFEKLGHTVYVFAPKTKGYKDKNPNVFRFPSIDFNYKISFPLPIPCCRRIGKILENLDIDIIHSQHPNLLGSYAHKWAKKKNIPLVFTWHTLYDKYAHFVPLIPSSLISKLVIKNAVKYANRCSQIIVPTGSVGDIIEGWGVINKKIEAIATGVSEKIFKNSDGKSVREKYGIKDDEILIFVASRLTEEKNMEFLFDAVLDVLEKKPEAKFMIVGEGSLEKKLIKMAEKSGFGGRTIFPGLIGSKNISSYYAAADIFVYASKSETQGMVLTEAMYAGLPIVAVDATGVKNIVQNDETGFLTKEDGDDFSGAVAKLVEDEKLRKQFGENAARIAREKYTSSACAQKMLEVYRQAIDRKKKQ